VKTRIYFIDSYHQVWSAVVKSEVEDDPDIMDLSLIVRFKLKVYFTIIVQKEMKQKDSKMTDERKERLARFLHEDGTRYSKFPELAPYFALPYIKESNHPIIADIQSVIITLTILFLISIMMNIYTFIG